MKEQIEEPNESNLTLRQKTGDAANKWLARNRSLVLRQTPVWAQSLAVIVAALGGIVVIGGIFFRIDEVVSVQGQLKSVGGTVEVKTPAGGRIAEVFFQDGEKVEADQLLIRFDTRQASQQKKTLLKLIDLERKQLITQEKGLQLQISTLNGRKDVLENRLTTQKYIVNEMEKLVTVGGFQRIQFLQKRDELFELQTQLSEIEEQRSRLTLQINQVKVNSEKMIDQMQSDLQLAELQLQYQNVKSPISGIVFDPKVRALGVLGPGERIVSIVPQGKLYAEVYVPNSDIGYVKIGQESKIRVDAFPFTRYGELTGSISQISANALPPDQNQNFFRFPIKINLRNSYLEKKGIKIPLKPGMSIVSNLKLRDKRVISLVSDLLVDQTDSIKSIRQQ